MCSQIIKNVTKLPESNSTCSFSDENGCSIGFVYEEATNGAIMIYVKGNRNCAHSQTIVKGVKVSLLIVYIIFGIIMVGLILVLLYRFYTWHVDLIEYKQFVQEQKTKTKWNKEENPIYKMNERKYINPMYGK